MKIKFYGVRGSYPVPGKNTVVFGGNTTCVTIFKEVENKIFRIILDMGTGAISLGKEIANNYYQQKEDLNIFTLFTHLHPDHIQAFPFFAPNYFAECEMHLLGIETLKKTVGTILKQEMLPPTFPIEYSDLKSKRIHYVLRDGNTIYLDKNKKIYKEQNLSDELEQSELLFKIQVMQAFAPSHPQQGSLYYRITDLKTDKSAACIWDLESHPGGDKRVINFAKDCDLMIHDAQYLHEEYENDRMIVQGFGHSTYEMAIDNAFQARVKDKLICTHFNPNHSDGLLEKTEKRLQKDFIESGKVGFEVLLAREGLEIEV